MASSRPAPEAPFASAPASVSASPAPFPSVSASASASAAPAAPASPDELDARGAFDGPGYARGGADIAAGHDADRDGEGDSDGGSDGDGPWEEWNPTEESVRAVRGKHRVVKQRTGGLARGGTVLGVGVIAAVGAGGMATAEDRPPVPISMPDIGGLAHEIADSLPDAESLPGVGDLISGAGADDGANSSANSGSGSGSEANSPSASGPLSEAIGAGSGTGAGEALRSRILQQADAQQDAAEAEAREAAENAAVKQAAKEAAEAQKAAEKAEAAKKAAELEAKREAEEEARRKAEAERLAQLAKSFTAPVSSYTLTASFGQAGDRWAADHTGQDFAAPTGTPVKAVHSGTITQAGWAGAYGYRIVLTLDDGTELWFCHLSSMVKTSGKVTTGDVIGRVGATGNVTGPHLHLEVRPGAGDPIDPVPWLREHGIAI
ncbi:M23 family metallopeptidase [Streptomyces sp. NPDC001339]|uniref:M23 family metallopeptidase n=1 Tax=Streptomyces sp. NPDC001339 TaxID=3364563 RepID=UPI00369A0A41